MANSAEVAPWRKDASARVQGLPVVRLGPQHHLKEQGAVGRQSRPLKVYGNTQQRSSFDATALFNQALRAYRRGAYAQAYRRFSDVLKLGAHYPESDSALFWMGLCQTEMGHLDKAAAAFGALWSDYPSSPKNPEALLRLGLIYRRQHRSREAREVFRYLTQTHPRSPAAELGRMHLGRDS